MPWNRRYTRAFVQACRGRLDLAGRLAAHRVALREWLDELDEKRGAPSAEQLTAAKVLLDAIKHGEVDGTSAA